MITYDELFKVKEFSDATVLAGKTGLSRRHIKWCHIIYGRDVEGWLKQNSLLIITGLGLHNNKDAG